MRLPDLQQIEGSEISNSDGEDCYPVQTRILMSLIFSALSLVGIVGNLLVVVVVKKVPGMITPTNCYLVSLAISDCLFFVAATPTELSYLHVPCTKYAFGAVGCSIFSYLPYLAINSSSMSITAFTVERFIGICYPLRARYICTVKRAKLIIWCIWMFCIVYNSPWLYLAALKVDANGDEFCGFRNDRGDWAYKVVYLSDLIFWYSIPMVLNIFIYVKITYTLNRCPNDLMRCAPSDYSAKQHPPVNSSLSRDSQTSALRSNGHDRDFFVNIGKNAIKSKVQVIKMLAVVVVVFAVCWLPYRAMVMYNSFVSSENGIWNPDWYIFLSKTLIFVNCAVNPILYNLMSKRFRSAFRRLLNKEKYLAEELRRNSGPLPPSAFPMRPTAHLRRALTKNMSVDDKLLSSSPRPPEPGGLTVNLNNGESKSDSETLTFLRPRNNNDLDERDEVTTCVTLLISENGVRTIQQAMGIEVIDSR